MSYLIFARALSKYRRLVTPATPPPTWDPCEDMLAMINQKAQVINNYVGSNPWLDLAPEVVSAKRAVSNAVDVFNKECADGVHWAVQPYRFFGLE